MNNIKNRIDKATKYLKILSQAEKELKLAKKAETELRKKALIKIAIKAKEYINKQKALKIKGGGTTKEKLINAIIKLNDVATLENKDKIQEIINNMTDNDDYQLTSEDKQILIELIYSIPDEKKHEYNSELITIILILINYQEKEIELTIDLIKRKKAMINELKINEELMGSTNQTKEISKYIIKLISIKQKLNTEIEELNETIKINEEIKGKLIDKKNELFRNS